MRAWINHRANHAGLHGRAHISRQRRLALWMTVFAGMRTAAWVVAMLLVGAYWAT